MAIPNRLPLHGMTVVVTGLRSRERDRVEKAVAELGGTVPAADAVLNRQDPPVACVAGSVSTARYAACASLLLPMPVPVVKPSWLRACVEAKKLVRERLDGGRERVGEEENTFSRHIDRHRHQNGCASHAALSFDAHPPSRTSTSLLPLPPQVPFDKKHALGPLAGLRICLTGGTGEDKRPIAQALERAGAFYSGDLTRDCTHLVVVRGLPPPPAAAAGGAGPPPPPPPILMKDRTG